MTSAAESEVLRADDLTYVHSSARLESKKEHLANLRAGKPHYRGIAPKTDGHWRMLAWQSTRVPDA